VVEVDEEVEAKLDVVAVGQVRPAMALHIARRESVGELAGVDVLRTALAAATSTAPDAL
jgi:hypothetical protein